MAARGAIELPAGRRGRARRRGRLRPAEPDVPVRRLRLRRRRRPGHRRGQGAALRRRRRLRHAHQPDDRRGPDPRRADRRRRDGADGDDRVRRGRQLPRRLADGLPDPDRGRGARLGDRLHRHAVAAPPDRRQGDRRVGDRRLAAGDRQRDLRRAAPSASPRGHAVHTVAGLGRDARKGGRRNDQGRARPAHGAAARRARAVRDRDRRARGEADERAAGRLRARARRRDDRGLRRRRLRAGVGAAARRARAGDRRGRAAAAAARRGARRGRAAQDGVVVAPQPLPERRLAGDLPRPAARRAARSSIVGDTPIARALADGRAGRRLRRRARAAATSRRSVRRRADRRLARRRRGGARSARALEAGVGYVALVASRKRGAAVLRRRSTCPTRCARAIHTPAGPGHRRPHAGRHRDLDPRRAGRRSAPPARLRRSRRRAGRPRSTRSAAWRSWSSDATIHLDVGGERVYFCCEGCRSTYAAQHAGDAAPHG